MNIRVIIKENKHLSRVHGSDMGWGNGYIVIPADHPLHGMPYNRINVSVHYGLTYGQIIDEATIKGWTEVPADAIGGWFIGFDTCHHADTLESWPKDRVREETEDLAIAIAAGEYSIEPVECYNETEKEKTLREAAPDMLAALQTILDLSQHNREPEPDDMYSITLCAKAAIAKALGK